MDLLLLILVRALTVIFYTGMIGCAVVIPMVAWKFAAVLFEKDEPQHAVTD